MLLIVHGGSFRIAHVKNHTQDDLILGKLQIQLEHNKAKAFLALIIAIEIWDNNVLQVAALVPKPRINLTRFHGVFVRGGPPPNSRHRVTITPAKRNKAKQALPKGQERGAKT